MTSYDINGAGGRFWDKEGKRLSMAEWAVLRDDLDYLRIGRTEITDEVLVSTVWVGMDLGISLDPTPMIFETMVFGEGEHKYDESYMERYATLAQAEAGHEAAVAMMREKLT